jgi:hypothetical protein
MDMNISALDGLERVQAELQAHVVTDTGGRCAGCGQAEPCRPRDTLTGIILSFGQLPVRQPGATKAGLRRR